MGGEGAVVAYIGGMRDRPSPNGLTDVSPDQRQLSRSNPCANPSFAEALGTSPTATNVRACARLNGLPRTRSSGGGAKMAVNVRGRGVLLSSETRAVFPYCMWK